MATEKDTDQTAQNIRRAAERSALPEGTLPVPETFVQEPAEPELQDKATLEPPKAQISSEPMRNYDKMTIGEILKEVKDADNTMRLNVLAYERKNKNRQQIIDAVS